MCRARFRFRINRVGREPDVRLGWKTEADWKTEAGRHHADDVEGPAAEPEEVSERLGNPAEVIRAVGVADDGCSRASLLRLIGGEFTSRCRRHLENAEEFRRNLSNVRVLGGEP